jgi:ATP-dependent Clp protease protease subunit
MAIIPYVIETTPRGERGMDIYSRLLRDRIIFVGSAIDEQIANLLVAQLLLLKSEDADKDIQIYVNSPGGSIYAGMAMSFGTVLLAGGTKGMRYALPNSTIHMHQPWAQGSRGGQASDIEIEAREILRLRSRLNDILSGHTGQPLERIQRDTDRDYFMTADQAVQYGIIDGVIASNAVELPKVTDETSAA